MPPSIEVVYQGTCGVCSEPHILHPRSWRLVRHGWKVRGASRRESWHEGSCFGSNRRPLERSAEAVVAFLDEVLRPLKAEIDSYLLRLSGEPPLRYAGVWPAPGRASWGRVGEYRVGSFEVRLRPGDPESPRVPSYAAHHGRLVREAEERRGGVVAEIARCEKMVTGWSPAPLVPVRPRVETLHYAARDKHRAGKTMCGRVIRPARGPAVRVAAEYADVTCVRCAPKAKPSG